MRPNIGSTIVTLGVVSSNGTDAAPAIVTRVWGNNDPADGAPVCVNVTVFPDLASQPVRTQGSISLFETRAEAEREQARLNAIGDNEAVYRARGLSGPMVAFWPDRG